MATIRVRNVNDAYEQLKVISNEYWRKISPRGKETIEYPDIFITDYLRPTERVLFDPYRDANPFFHFFESLWMLAGRSDVEFLAQFNSKISQFSDDGVTFHGSYGQRLRNHFPDYKSVMGGQIDQITKVINMFNRDVDTRQAVLGIWDPSFDLGESTKDMPCNDLIFLKVRDGQLNMTVCCRSNDAVLGAYGANAVQFSVLQEFIARSIGVQIGRYVQVSDSFHIYTSEPAWLRSKDRKSVDPYPSGAVEPYPLMRSATDPFTWLAQLKCFLNFSSTHPYLHPDPFFNEVAKPMLRAWLAYKDLSTEKNKRIDAATTVLKECAASDWRLACTEWLERRKL